MPQQIHVIDSHTAGEPTRVVVTGGPDLGDGPLSDRVTRFRDSHDPFRTAVVCEPRGSDVLVGALLVPPHDQTCDAGVIFFNNVGFLGMCGHGMIGVVETLKHLGRVGDSCKQLRIETPVGVVVAAPNQDASVSIDNVVSYRSAKDVTVSVDQIGSVVGDVAWGGNWFFLVTQPRVQRSYDIRQLQQMASAIRIAINQSGFPDVDHVELFCDPEHSDSDSRNFVLCPGLQYDRSPCGTGTSAKLACLAADGKLQPGERWNQEGVLGTIFHGRYRWDEPTKKSIIPTITGSAHVTSESTLIVSAADPFGWGIRS